MKVNLIIDNKKIEAGPGQTILDAAKANGIDIPTLCFHKDLGPIAACRMCVVEVQGAKNLTASCCAPVAEGMVVQTGSEKVRKARKVILNLLLSSHAHNCIMCSTSNICELQKLAVDYGVCASIYKNKKRYYRPEDESPYIYRDLSKCILCYRCVKACKNIKKANLYAVSYRGFDMKITADTDIVLNKEDCKGCDICITTCPVGALLPAQNRFGKKRPEPLIITG